MNKTVKIFGELKISETKSVGSFAKGRVLCEDLNQLQNEIEQKVTNNINRKLKRIINTITFSMNSAIIGYCFGINEYKWLSLIAIIGVACSVYWEFKNFK